MSAITHCVYCEAELGNVQVFKTDWEPGERASSWHCDEDCLALSWEREIKEVARLEEEIAHLEKKLIRIGNISSLERSQSLRIPVGNMKDRPEN